MLVTRENFESILPDFKIALGECHFVSFDLEMSGIRNRGPENAIKRTDDPNLRYTKVSQAASRYAIIQIGICLWTRASGKKSSSTSPWLVKEFTFFLFPHQGGDLCLDPDSVKFLRNNNMDFGMWLSSGIPYCDRRQTEWLTAKWGPSQESSADAENEKPPPIELKRPADIEFMNRQKTAIAKFMNEDMDADEVILETCNNFLRKATYQWLERDYPDLVLDSVEDPNRSFRSAVRARRLSPSEKARVEAEKLAANAAKLSSELGFTQAYQMMCEANKPIVGHNCFSDLLFVMSKLDHLPDSFNEFKTVLHEEGRTPFRRLFDTKYLAEADILKSTDIGSSQNRDTALGPLYQLVKTQEKIEVQIVQSAEENLEEQLHSAGYDAYITGYIFAAFLEDDCFAHQKGVSSLEVATEITGGYLFMMLSLLHLDLRLLGGRGGERNGWLKIPAESTLYHISGFPEKMGEPLLYKFFTDAGLDSRRLQFIWINGTSCFLQIDAPLALSDEEVKNGIKPQKDIQFYMKGVNFGEYTEIKVQFYDDYLGEKEAPEESSRNPIGLGTLINGLTPPFVTQAAQYVWSIVTKRKMGENADPVSNKRVKK